MSSSGTRSTTDYQYLTTTPLEYLLETLTPASDIAIVRSHNNVALEKDLPYSVQDFVSIDKLTDCPFSGYCGTYVHVGLVAGCAFLAMILVTVNGSKLAGAKWVRGDPLIIPEMVFADPRSAMRMEMSSDMHRHQINS